jgi:hypothetical protein
LARISKSKPANGRNGSRIVRWHFRTADDVKDFWKKFQRVPARKRRTKRDEERYCLGLYLLALATHRKLKYPLRIEEGESPDFIITWSSRKSANLEIIKASEMWVESEVANGNGKPDWFASVRRAIESRTEYLAGERRDFLVYEDTPVPLAERPQALAALRQWLDGLKEANPLLGKISLITSLDVALDTGGEFRDLPFVNWSKPGSMPDFGERIEFAGQKAVATAIRKHEDSGHPVYFTDSRGRLVRRMPDGARYEVEVEDSGDEVVIGELDRK